MKNADGPNEIEFWAADIDVCAVLSGPECEVGGNEVYTGIRGAPSKLNWVNGVARWKGLSRSSAAVLEERIKDALSTV